MDIVDHQSRSMRNNIIVDNVPEETNERCEDKVRAILKSKMGLPEKSINPIKIERAHRIGAPRHGPKPRPRLIVVRLSFFKDRELILEAWKSTNKDRPPRGAVKHQRLATKNHRPPTTCHS